VPTGLIQFNSTGGGIQPALSGEVFWDMIEKGVKSNISKQELLKATLATILLGMYDLHGCNFIIDSDNKIHFFDNSRSFPHSNGFIQRGNFLVSSYRSALLEDPKCAEELLQEDLELINKTVEEWSRRLPHLTKYLKSDYVQKLIQKLPPNWLNVDDAVAAMVERITSIQTAMATTPPQTIVDLVVCANPGYKFAYALELAHQKITTGTAQWVHNQVGFNTIDFLVNLITGRGYSVNTLRSIANNPNYSWSEMCHAIEEEIKKGPKNNDLLTELYRSAKLDRKDF
jgi:hypothetical protein